MDEVGAIVTYIRDDGTLCFGEVGRIDPSVLIGRQVVVGKDNLSGVIGSTAVHNLSKEEREISPKIEGLYIDIGASSKEEAEKYVSLGDCVYFDSEFIDLGSKCIKSKAIDDRAGCALMIKLILEEPKYDTYFVFNVQEEIGLRGSRVSAFSVAPDFAMTEFPERKEFANWGKDLLSDSWTEALFMTRNCIALCLILQLNLESHARPKP